MARSPFVRGQLPDASADRDRWEKPSQSKPSILYTLESDRYAVSARNKAIDINCHFFSYLRRQNADFSKRMAQGDHKSRFGKSSVEIGNWKLEIGNPKIETRKSQVAAPGMGATSRKPRAYERIRNAI